MKSVAIIVFVLTGVICGAVLIRAFSQPSTEFTVVENIKTPIISKDDPSLGPEDAPVKIVHYGHVACDFCRSTHDLLLDVVEDNSEHIQLIWKDFPNTSLAPESLNAAIAGRCADKQGKFWEYQETLFMYGRDLHEEIYVSLAESTGLRPKAFERCYKKQQTEELVLENINEAEALELTATPTVFINEKRFTGQLQPKTLNAAIADALQDL